MAKTRCYRIDFDLFPAAIGRGCANVALNIPLLPLGRALFSFRSSFFSRLGLGQRLRLRLRHRLHFLVAFVVVVVVGATSAPFASWATCTLGAIHQRRQFRASRFQHQITAQHAQWDALWRFKYADVRVEWRDSMCDSFGCGLRLRIRIGFTDYDYTRAEHKIFRFILFVCGLDIYSILK